MNTPTWNNMTFSEKERYSYLNGLPCAESRAELLDREEMMIGARRHLQDALDFADDNIEARIAIENAMGYLE